MTDGRQSVFADLHMHTVFSDGAATPSELVRAASEAGIGIIAITDHDCTSGVDSAITTAEVVGIEVIPAAEITCEWPGYSWPEWGGVDVLAYFIDHTSAGWLRFERRLRADLESRVRDCCQRLSARGVPLSVSSVLSLQVGYKDVVSIVRVLMANGYVGSYREGVSLVAPVWSEGRVASADIAMTIQAIRRAGGVAVLAHPAVLRGPRGELCTDDVAILRNLGLGGIEVFHHSLAQSERPHWSYIASVLGLAITGGSDEHGRPGSFSRIGVEPIHVACVEELRLLKKGN